MMSSGMSVEELMSALDAIEEKVPRNMKKKVQELKDIVADFEDEEVEEDEDMMAEEEPMMDEESEGDESYEDEELAKMFG